MTTKKILSVEAAEELVNEVKRLKDALISREMRVRELEAVLRFFEDEAISSHPAEFVNSWTAEAFSEKVRLALNSKGEKK